MEDQRKFLVSLSLFAPLRRQRKCLHVLSHLLTPASLSVIPDPVSQRFTSVNLVNWNCCQIPLGSSFFPALIFLLPFRRVFRFVHVRKLTSGSEEKNSPLIEISSTLFHNLLGNNVQPGRRIHLQTDGSVSAKAIVVPFACATWIASSARFEVLSSPDDDLSKCQNLLSRELAVPKFLCLGDSFAVEFHRHETTTLSEDLYLDGSSVARLLNGAVHFRVVDLKTQGKMDAWGIFVVGSSVCEFLLENVSDSSSFLLPPLSDGGPIAQSIDNYCLLGKPEKELRSLLVRFLSCEKSHLKALMPTILILGERSCGKVRLVRRTVASLGLPLFVCSSYSLHAETVGAIEAKILRSLSAARDHAKHQPLCVLLLSDVDRFGFLEGRRSSRALRALGDVIKNASHAVENASAVVVIGTSTKSPNEFDPFLSRLFPHKIEIGPCKFPLESVRRTLTEAQHHIPPCIRDCNSDSVSAKIPGTHSLGALEDLCFRYRLAFATNPDEALNDEDVCFQRSLLSWMQDEGIKSSLSDSSWADVGGLAQAKREVLDTIEFPLKHPEFSESGLRRGGALLHGPPGCGKTLLARAVAAQCSLAFVSIKGPELINMYVGQSEANIRAVFQRARAAAPCVIFFDEVDSLAPARGRSGDAGGVLDRIVSQFLAELDELNSFVPPKREEDGESCLKIPPDYVFALAATNRPDLVDASFLRPGRFDRIVYVGPPDTIQERVQVVRAASRKMPLHPEIDLNLIAELFPKHSTGAEISAFVRMAAKIAIRRTLKQKVSSKELMIAFDDFRDAVAQMQPPGSTD